MKVEKVEKLVTNLRDKPDHVIHIRDLKQALNHGLVLKKVHRVIKCSTKTIHWYEYRSKKKKQKIILKKIFLSWWIMQFLGKL